MESANIYFGSHTKKRSVFITKSVSAKGVIAQIEVIRLDSSQNEGRFKRSVEVIVKAEFELIIQEF